MSGGGAKKQDTMRSKCASIWAQNFPQAIALVHHRSIARTAEEPVSGITLRLQVQGVNNLKQSI